MKRFIAVASALFVIVTTVGAEETRPSEGSSSMLTIHHTWTAPSEIAALNALVDVFKKKHPGILVRAAAAPGRGTIFSIVRSGQSDAFAIQAGATLEPFLDSMSVADIDALWASEGLDKRMPPIVQKLNRRDGHHYSLPIAVHRNNLVWYNKALLDKHRIDPETLTTWEAFFKAADVLRAGGVRHPVQMGLTWTATQVFEGIMAGLGRTAYEDWLNGRVRAPDDPRILEAFTTFRRYLEYTNEDHRDTPWDGALHRVITGESAFIVMGDWAEKEFQLAGMRYGRDYGAIPEPGT